MPESVTIRPALPADVPALTKLIHRSARQLSRGFYTERESESAIQYVFGVDSSLIADGTYYIVDAFMVVIVGGAGQVVGATLAALGIGGLNMAFELGSTASLGKVAVLITVIAFLQWRPAGLIARRGR